MAHWPELNLGELSDREILILVAQRQNELCGHVERQNGRIGKLEAWRNQAAGVLLVLAIIIPAVVSWLMGKL